MNKQEYKKPVICELNSNNTHASMLGKDPGTSEMTATPGNSSMGPS